MCKTLTLLITCWCLCLPSSAVTADELAREVIKEESAVAHNIQDDTEEELQRAAAANSRLRLNWLMLNDASVTEEIRISYAIRVIDDRLGLHQILRSGVQRTPQEEVLLKKRLLLGKRLLELDKTKAEQGGTGQPATRPESKSEGSDKLQPESEGRSR
jgi:hypothetical protein